jgi:N-methylhydantoinase A
VERGHDPREFTLVPFGGAGPLHGCALADLLGITRVLVPPAPGVLCAEGLLAARLKAEFSRTLPRPDEWDAAEGAFAALEAQAEAWFGQEHVAPGDRLTARVALLRYEGQGSELPVAWPGTPAAARAAFAAAHQALNGFTLEANVELITLRVEAEAGGPGPARPLLADGAGAETSGWHSLHEAAEAVAARVFERTHLGTGDRFAGPAIVTQLDATTLVPARWTAEVLNTGALLLRRGVVMAGEGPPSTSFLSATSKDVDGRPSPTMTVKSSGGQS